MLRGKPCSLDNNIAFTGLCRCLTVAAVAVPVEEANHFHIFQPDMTVVAAAVDMLVEQTL